MNYKFLAGTNLFRGIREEEIASVLTCFAPKEVRYEKDQIIYRAGDVVTQVGLVLSGSVNIVVNFYWGGSNIFAHVETGALFAETYAAIPGRELPNDVVAAEAADILFLDMRKMTTTCSNSCGFHQRLIHNLLRISAIKNINLSNRMMHIASKSIRDRLLSYLSEQSVLQGKSHFRIPFDRQQLADYLGVDRSAMSNELSKMQRDGLIQYHRNEFMLIAKSV